MNSIDWTDPNKKCQFVFEIEPIRDVCRNYFTFISISSWKKVKSLA